MPFHELPMYVICTLSIAAYFITKKAIPLAAKEFIKYGVSGKDLLKDSKPVTAESMGMIVGCVYFCCLFLFIPVPFIDWIETGGYNPNSQPPFPHHKFAQFLGGMLSLLAMLLLGFADDVLNIKWRVKIWFPFIASVPLLMVYYVTHGGTDVLVPIPLRPLLNTKLIHLGWFYYFFMSALSVFCTHSINIIAGINGVEGGQGIVIAISLSVITF
ncbi:hypothetical protein HDV04_002101 [Boothiomyces sp. JEL0838]|nr:hypothetical protein HDV04_002101 [Boothiomyces sp. JEL0838]